MPRPPCVLITGATGFVGSWLVKRLKTALPAETQVIGLDHHAANGGVRLDITDRAAVDSVVKDARPFAVVHLAAISSLADTVEAGRRAWDVNFFGTMNLAESILTHVPEANLVFAGSSEVYGASFNGASGAVDETALLAPRNVYAATKAAADLLIGQMAAQGLRATRFRAFNHTGPGQSDRFVVPAFAAQIAAIERGDRPPIIKVGNLDAQRDFLDVRDVVEAYRLAMTLPAQSDGRIYNLASGIPRRIGDVLSAMLTMSRCRIEIQEDVDRLRRNDTPLAIGDASHAARVLGWRPKIDWDVTLRDVLNSHRRP